MECTWTCKRSPVLLDNVQERGVSGSTGDQGRGHLPGIIQVGPRNGVWSSSCCRELCLWLHASFRLAPVSELWAFPSLVLSQSITAIHREAGREMFLETLHWYLHFLKRWAKCQSRNGNLSNLWDTVKFHLLGSKEWLTVFFFSQKFLTKAILWSLECWTHHMKALTFLVWKTQCCCHFSLFEGMGFLWCCEHTTGHFPPREKKALFPPPPETVGDRDVHQRIRKIWEIECECHCSLLQMCQCWVGIK